MNKDDTELTKILKKNPIRTKTARLRESKSFPVSAEEHPHPHMSDIYCQWMTSNGFLFQPAKNTSSILSPGVYDIGEDVYGNIHFELIKVNLDGLIKLPDSTSNKVIDEIKKFWNMHDIYKKHKIDYKRGICLWGPPGSGKSCTVKFVMRDVINLGGIAINFTHPTRFISGIRIFREIQPDTPVVVLMEDIDNIIEQYDESIVLNFLDGINSIENVVFLATTNYPEKLGARIINRPSRFDKRFKIGHPNANARLAYFQYLINESGIEPIDLDRWVEDTHGFSIAHLKELYVATTILGDNYEDTIGTLRGMSENMSSNNYDENRFGFIDNEH